MQRYNYRTIPLMVGLALLAGCANIGSHRNSTYTGFSQEGYDTVWTHRDDDQIGLLLAQKVRHTSQSASGHFGGSPANNTLLAAEALNHLGIRYRHGGGAPHTGFDCSGLVGYVAEQSVGLTLPRTAAEISQLGTSISRNDLQIGDLVFFNTRGRRYSHVGIYLGEDRFVHAPRHGSVVRIERMSMAYWNKRYNGARRLDTTTLASALAQN